jgi:hypothetical protein
VRCGRPIPSTSSSFARLLGPGANARENVGSSEVRWVARRGGSRSRAGAGAAPQPGARRHLGYLSTPGEAACPGAVTLTEYARPGYWSRRRRPWRSVGRGRGKSSVWSVGGSRRGRPVGRRRQSAWEAPARRTAGDSQSLLWPVTSPRDPALAGLSAEAVASRTVCTPLLR